MVMEKKEGDEISIFLKVLFTIQLILVGAFILYIVYVTLIG
jgi:hypothetical protein